MFAVSAISRLPHLWRPPRPFQRPSAVDYDPFGGPFLGCRKVTWL